MTSNPRRPRRISLTQLQLLYVLLTLLILVAAGGYLLRHTQDAAQLARQNQEQVTRTLINTRALQERHAWLLGLLRDLSRVSARLQAEFEMLTLDAGHERARVRGLYIQLQRLQEQLGTERARSFAERLAPLRDYLRMLLSISHDLLNTEDGLAPARTWQDTWQALEAVGFEIRRIEADVQAEAEALAERVGVTVQEVERNGQRINELFAAIGRVQTLVLIAVFAILAGSTVHLFLIFQQRMRALSRYAGQIGTERLIAPPFKSSDPTGLLASQMYRMARRIRRLFREAREATDTAETLAWYDPLTGLENRRRFGSSLARALSESGPDSEWVLIVLDLDGFKTINDSLGHDTADNLLRVVARRLQEFVRDGEHLARMGGDEFALLVRRSEDGAARLAERLLAALREPVLMDSHRLLVTTSMGIAVVGADGDTSRELLRNAELALYKAKENGRDCFRFFSPELNETAQRKIRLLAAMRTALEESRFDLYFQAKVDLKSGRISGLEALIRWPLGGGRFESPAEFIPLAEESGLILPIGEWVLRRACAEGVRLLDRGTPVPVAVNISARQFVDQDFVIKVAAILEETGLPPQLLEVEVTETLLLNDLQLVIRVLTALRKMGVRVALDDFGTGFSSLEYLKHLPVDVLKIDRSFARALPDDEHDAAIVESVIGLAHRLGLEVVCEGVEERVQAAWLADVGCDHGQGTLFSEPVPAEQLQIDRVYEGANTRQRA